MRYILVLVLLLCSVVRSEAITYTKADSIKVVNLLVDGKKAYEANVGMNLMLYYGKKFVGIPYVAHTLEVNRNEELVVNLRQLDCTTYVETVFALCMTTVQGSVLWNDYCDNLQKIRYRNCKPEGYMSRNHYFLWWMKNNKRHGFVTTPMDDDMKALVAKGKKCPHFVMRQSIDINYMSTHSSAYSMLKGCKKDINTIAAMEKASKGKVVYYIPPTKVGLSYKQLQGYVRDGDILAIATKIKGLDTSHIGIASWGKDGKLHLLNASQVRSKVVLEPMTLQTYMKKHPKQLGIWVLRPVFNLNGQ